MPTYQYACRSCDHRFEAVQGFHEDALTTCPDCGREELRKKFGSVGVVFKGSGFYRTDSRSGAKSGAGQKSKSAAEAAPAPGGSSTASETAGSSAAASTTTGSSAAGSKSTSAKAPSAS